MISVVWGFVKGDEGVSLYNLYTKVLHRENQTWKKYYTLSMQVFHILYKPTPHSVHNPYSDTLVLLGQFQNEQTGTNVHTKGLCYTLYAIRVDVFV